MMNLCASIGTSRRPGDRWNWPLGRFRRRRRRGFGCRPNWPLDHFRGRRTESRARQRAYSPNELATWRVSQGRRRPCATVRRPGVDRRPNWRLGEFCRSVRTVANVDQIGINRTGTSHADTGIGPCEGPPPQRPGRPALQRVERPTRGRRVSSGTGPRASVPQGAAARPGDPTRHATVVRERR